MENFHWTCPFCNRDTTITNSNFSSGDIHLPKNTKYEYQIFLWKITICPNPFCKEYTFSLTLNSAEQYHNTFATNTSWRAAKSLKQWDLIPQSNAKVFPEYIPQQLRNDYCEACAILKLSPKASATLARRCLQGMIRDFWGIKNKDTLKQEIDAIQAKVDPLTWQAIEAVRNTGNIGAHMEKDVNLIIDFTPDEAERLISLIEILFQDWYITRHEREENLRSIQQIAIDKTALKKEAKKQASE